MMGILAAMAALLIARVFRSKETIRMTRGRCTPYPRLAVRRGCGAYTDAYYRLDRELFWVYICDE
jgi:hypothetical protein